MVKCDNALCSQGWLFERGIFRGRCECSKQKYLDAYYQWSKAPKTAMKKRVSELQDVNLYFDLDENATISLKEEVQNLLEIKDELFDGAVIGLKGTVGQGKTQLALTIAIEMLMDLDWDTTNAEIEKNITPFLFCNLEFLLQEGVLFDDEKKKIFIKKARNAKILIIDELGDELNKKDTDGRKQEILDFLKLVLDNFEGLIIYTTNDLEVEAKYEGTGRYDILSRLFSYERDNYIVYGIENGFDFRDVKNEKLSNFKKRFAK